MGMILGLFYFELLDPLVGLRGAVMILIGISILLLPIACVMLPMNKKSVEDKETDPDQDNDKTGKQRDQESKEYVKDDEQQSKENNGKETDQESKKKRTKETDQSDKDNTKEDKDNKRKETDLENQNSLESTLGSDEGTISICGRKVGLLISCSPSRMRKELAITLSPDAKKGLQLLNVSMKYQWAHFFFQVIAGGFATNRFLGTFLVLLQSGDTRDAASFIITYTTTFLCGYIISQAVFLKMAYSSRCTNVAAVRVHIMSVFLVTVYGLMCLVPAICR